MHTLLLIDANSIIHRAFHALPPFTAPAKASAGVGGPGRPTGALYGLASIFLKLFREEKPDYAAAAFDRPEPTFRKEKYKEYKAQRPPAPNELISQIIEAHNLFVKFGIKTFESPGWEADDIIATLSEKFGGGENLRVVILTGDRDAIQLVCGDKIVVRAFKKGVSDTVIYDEEMVLKEYGLKPEQMIDYKALVGDPSDNIKGVPGIGPKTAAKILKEYGTLDNLLRHAEKDEKLRKIAEAKDEALLAQNLVSLDKNAPLPDVNLEDLSVRENAADLKKYFEELGFETLIKRMDKNGEEDAGKKRPAAKKQGLF